jgi:glyoxylase-like metal-dependent hydrolase (beta-lactamase superfamily II)
MNWVNPITPRRNRRLVSLPDELFAVPEGWSLREPPPRPRNAVTAIAPGVFVLEQIDGHDANVLFVELGDAVLVVEAPEEPEHAGLGETAIATIRDTLPGRAIRWVVPSHHHVDHGAGLRPYLALGAAVITTPGNVGFVERIAAAPFALRPDALAVSPRSPRIELLERGRRVIEAGGRRVELHDVGPDGHVDETIATWLPAERVLFLADQFETGYAEDARWDGGGRLGEILGEWGWDPIWVVTPHSRPRRMRDLRDAS